MDLFFKKGDQVLVDPLHGMPNKNSRRFKKMWLENYHDMVYTWKLSRYLRPYQGYQMFSYYNMDERLGELYYVDVLLYLNTTKVFDFDYESQEGDYLTIYYQYKVSQKLGKQRLPDMSQFMAFKYEAGQWVYEQYYGDELEVLTEGILCVEK